jgi:hypothetical protein
MTVELEFKLSQSKSLLKLPKLILSPIILPLAKNLEIIVKFAT